MADIEINGLDTVETSALKQFDPLAAEGAEIGTAMSEQQITTDRELAAANDLKKRANGYAKTIKDMRLAITRPIDAVKDSLIRRERELLEPVEQGKSVLGGNILAYEDMLEKRRLEEEARISGLIQRVRELYRPGMTAHQVGTGRTAAKALMVELGNDAQIPRVKLALVELSNNFTQRITDIGLDEQRARKEKLDTEQAQIEAERIRLAATEARQEAERAQLEADKAARAAERDRPKSNIHEDISVEILDAEAVPRNLCSPDMAKIRQTVKDFPDADYSRFGIKVTKTRKVR